MIEELLDNMSSLTAIMEEESDRLVAPGRVPDLSEMAVAKNRLVGLLEAKLAQLSRERADWMELLDEADRSRLAAAVAVLRDASLVNADVLERQIELSTELMAAIAQEAQRLMGTRQATYGAHGGLLGMDLPAPISLNARL
ncbi:flagellar protein FlgN [Sphingomonas sp. IC-11]|uniref:flagellar protein FlgN n=1 Tax=Sphingomonas sp. IC-11 TaxID=2898528 RepID=UPI001E56FD77|nr:flagellar protein FlgN [Sphingomonas sp. IC-11]MCD2317082.1 flagellar protein FlgN [Sphingomonas sp. IC-11]